MTKDRFRWHGGRVAEAKAVYGNRREPWIDLSTGINPNAWPGTGAVAPDWRGLPDPAALAALEDAAAAHFGLSPSCVCAVPGSEVGLRMIGHLLTGPAFYLTPCYRSHAAMFNKSAPVRRPHEAPAGSTLLLANPNNPDGRLFGGDQMQALCARQEAGGGWLVVDEAFADGMPAASLASQVGTDRRLIILRSFGKFFGLAGVRLGFVLAPPPIVAACRSLLGDWPVSAAAIAFGTAAYRDRAWIDSTADALRARAASLDALLARHGLAGRGECALFRLVAGVDAAALFDKLACHAILTRPFDDQPDWLRLGLPADDRQMERLDRALADG